MNKNQRCGTCKHFGDALTFTEYVEDDHDEFEVDTKFHTCNRVQHTYKCHLTSMHDSAGVMDGSDYHAALIVAEDFGCTLWEASE